MAVTQILEDYGSQATAWPRWQSQVLGRGQSESRADRAERERLNPSWPPGPAPEKAGRSYQGPEVTGGLCPSEPSLAIQLPGNSIENCERHTSSHRGTVLYVLV